MIGFLAQAMAESKRRVRQWKREGLLDRLQEVAKPVPGVGNRTTPSSSSAFAKSLRRLGPGAIIAEIKRASPSRGMIADQIDPQPISEAYANGGAAAISVLTESRWFLGSLDDLRIVRQATALPLLRKDFIIDEYDIAVARAAGADAVLLIAACLEEDRLGKLLAEAHRLGLDALVETHNAADLEKARHAGADLIGVNARNLQTLDVDVPRALKALAELPASCVKVLESGIRSRADVQAAIDAGADAVLVGETLMRATDPQAMLRELRGET